MSFEPKQAHMKASPFLRKASLNPDPDKVADCVVEEEFDNVRCMKVTGGWMVVVSLRNSQIGISFRPTHLMDNPMERCVRRFCDFSVFKGEPVPFSVVFPPVLRFNKNETESTFASSRFPYNVVPKDHVVRSGVNDGDDDWFGPGDSGQLLLGKDDQPMGLLTGCLRGDQSSLVFVNLKLVASAARIQPDFAW